MPLDPMDQARKVDVYDWHHTGRFAGLRRRVSIAGVAVAAPLAMASPAMAEHHPTGNFAPFKYCPLSNPATELCTVANTTSGESRRQTVCADQQNDHAAGRPGRKQLGRTGIHCGQGAETLSKTALYVPGGLFTQLRRNGSTKTEKSSKKCQRSITGVTATTELAKPASSIKLNTTNLIFEEGVALQLPIKVKLGNVFLGSECYAGSEASPVVLT